MKHPYWSRLLFAISISCLFISFSNATEPENKNSGYLPADIYARMEDVTTPNGVKVKRWHDPALNPRIYDAVLVEKVSFYPEKPEPNDKISASLLNDLSEEMTSELRTVISRNLAVVGYAKEGTLKFRSAITAVSTRTESFKARELLPIALIYSAFEFASGSRPDEAVIHFEWELRDGTTDRLLAAGTREGLGNVIKEKDGRISIEHLRPAIKAWGEDAKAAFGNM